MPCWVGLAEKGGDQMMQMVPLGGNAKLDNGLVHLS